MLRAVLLLAGLALVACGERPVVEVPVTHPANANAAEAPVPVASTTLSLSPHDQPSSGFDAPPRQIDQPLGHINGSPTGSGEPQAKTAGSSTGPAGEHAGMHMKSGATPTSDAEQPSGPGSDTSTGKAPEAGSWTCKMHPEVMSAQPGRCPKCHMQLIQKKNETTTEPSDQQAPPEHEHDATIAPEKAPQTDAAHAGHGQTIEASKEQAPDTGLWTCSMHPEVVSAKPGRCPKCNMKLIPKKDEKKDDKP